MKKRRIYVLLTALLLVFIWGNSLLSEDTSEYISDTLLEWLGAAAQRIGIGEDFFSGNGGMTPENAIRKAAHLLEFAALGVLTRVGFEKRKRFRSLSAFGVCVIVGALDETIQIFSHRGSQLRDVGVDSLGAAVGVVIAATVLYLRANRRKA